MLIKLCLGIKTNTEQVTVFTTTLQTVWPQFSRHKWRWWFNNSFTEDASSYELHLTQVYWCTNGLIYPQLPETYQKQLLGWGKTLQIQCGCYCYCSKLCFIRWWYRQSSFRLGFYLLQEGNLQIVILKKKYLHFSGSQDWLISWLLLLASIL
jgi:hypothetical protein